jgi:hypothetical protein
MNKGNIPKEIITFIDELSEGIDEDNVFINDDIVYTMKIPDSQYPPSITTFNALTCMSGYVIGDVGPNKGDGSYHKIAFKKLYIMSHKDVKTHDFIIYNTDTTVCCCISLKGRLKIATF